MLKRKFMHLVEISWFPVIEAHLKNHFIKIKYTPALGHDKEERLMVLRERVQLFFEFRLQNFRSYATV